MKSSECVKVVIRCRPLSSDEVTQGHKLIVQMDPGRGLVGVRNPKVLDEAPKEFSFDQVFDPQTQQENLYRDTAFPIVESVLEGYNGTIFAYGQTGTGKTFTMEGKDNPPALKGIIPRTVDHIFKRIEGMGNNKQFLVSASFLELYNEEVRDLLSKNSKNKLEIREKESGVYVKDLSKFMIQNAQEMKEKLLIGRDNRAVGATSMNQDSSRSHSLFMITVETNEFYDGEDHIRVGKLNLVDLAGSERQSKTKADGDRFKEAININQSLTTLGNVISALIDNKSQHIPYRDSKLTRLLQDSLGGNTKTVMVANIGPADYNYDETITTLRYAHRAKQIKNKPKINEDPKDAMLRQFQDEISKLRSQLEQAAQGGGNVGQGLGSGETQVIEVQKVVKVQNQDKIRELEQRLESEKESVHKRIEEERKKIEQQKNLAEEDKIKLLKSLQEKEEQQQAAREVQSKLIKKIQKMEQKVLQGHTEVEQAVMQQKELDNAMVQLEEQKAYQQQLASEIERKEEEMMKLKTKYNSQKEEVEDKTKRIKALFQRMKQIESENKELDEFYAREIDEQQERRRQVSQEVKLKQLILEYFIPGKELERMQMLAVYNEQLDDWMIQGLELTGNVVKKSRKPDDINIGKDNIDLQNEIAKPDLCSHPNVYFVYTEEGLVREEELAPQEKQKVQARQKSAKKPQSAKKRPSSKQTRLQSAKKSVSSSQCTQEENFPKPKGLMQKK